MNQATWTAVDSYISEVMLGSDPVQEETLRRNAAGELPSIDVTPNLGKLLYLLAKMRGAKRILETGTLGGYSTNMAGPCAASGRPSGDARVLRKTRAHANIARGVFADRVEIRVGPALESLV